MGLPRAAFAGRDVANPTEALVTVSMVRAREDTSWFKVELGAIEAGMSEGVLVDDANLLDVVRDLLAVTVARHLGNLGRGDFLAV